MTTDLTWLTAMEYLCHKWYVPLLVNTSRSLPHSWLITGFVTRLTRRVPLVDQELLTLPEHLSSYSIFSFMCMFCRSLFVLLYCFFWPLCCLFFDLGILITSLWYLQTLLDRWLTIYWYKMMKIEYQSQSK